MADLISRAALLKECAECQKTDPRFEGRGWANHFINEAGEPSTEWYCVEDMIENASAVDAAPVVHARPVWINPLDPGAKICTWKCSSLCSACGEYVAVGWKHCQNCGAKLDGEQRLAYRMEVSE